MIDREADDGPTNTAYVAEMRSLAPRVGPFRWAIPPAKDAVLAVGLALLASPQVGSPELLAVNTVALLALAWRCRHPLAVAAVIGGSSFLGEVLWGPTPLDFPLAAMVGLLVAMYSVGAHQPRLGSSVGGALVLGVGVNADLVLRGLSVDDFWPFRLVFLTGAWLAGRLVYRQRLKAEKLDDRVGQLMEDQATRAAAAVAAERARLARELHDVIAHGVSVMVIQAGAGQEILARSPEAAAEALRNVQATGRQTIGELQRLLGILRADDGDPLITARPNLAQLEALAERVRETGLSVTLSVEGEPRRLPASLDLSAYRILQEGLTNSLKHAKSASAKVVVRYAERALELEVLDDGVGRTRGQDGDGHGLLGIRERVALLGGTFEAANRPEGGFALRASLPLEAEGS